MVKPPLGIKPKYIHDSMRLDDLYGGILRRIQHNSKARIDGEKLYEIPIAWIEEYNELCDKENFRQPCK